MELHGPSQERAAMERRRAQVERLGYFSISVAGVIGVSLVLGIAGYYKLVLFGPEVLVWSAVGALIAFVLLAVAFLGYSKIFLTPTLGDSKPESGDTPLPAATTNRLLADQPIDGIPSVTEHSTELLGRRRE
jgi:hypothetical protein